MSPWVITSWLFVIILVLSVLHLWKNLIKSNSKSKNLEKEDERYNVYNYVLIGETNSFAILKNIKTSDTVYIRIKGKYSENNVYDIGDTVKGEKFRKEKKEKRDENGLPYFNTD